MWQFIIIDKLPHSRHFEAKFTHFLRHRKWNIFFKDPSANKAEMTQHRLEPVRIIDVEGQKRGRVKQKGRSEGGVRQEGGKRLKSRKKSPAQTDKILGWIFQELFLTIFHPDLFTKNFTRCASKIVYRKTSFQNPLLGFGKNEPEAGEKKNASTKSEKGQGTDYSMGEWPQYPSFLSYFFLYFLINFLVFILARIFILFHYLLLYYCIYLSMFF